jgi:hypothetical protein
MSKLIQLPIRLPILHTMVFCALFLSVCQAQNIAQNIAQNFGQNIGQNPQNISDDQAPNFTLPNLNDQLGQSPSTPPAKSIPLNKIINVAPHAQSSRSRNRSRNLLPMNPSPPRRKHRPPHQARRTRSKINRRSQQAIKIRRKAKRHPKRHPSPRMSRAVLILTRAPRRPPRL